MVRLNSNKLVLATFILSNSNSVDKERIFLFSYKTSIKNINLAINFLFLQFSFLDFLG